jgi:hypothetical protein
MRSSSMVASSTAAKDRQEARLRRATTLSNRETEDGGKTGQRRKAKQPPAGEDEAKARVEVREGDVTKPDFSPFLPDFSREILEKNPVLFPPGNFAGLAEPHWKLRLGAPSRTGFFQVPLLHT